MLKSRFQSWKHCMPSCLCWVGAVPEECRFRVVAYRVQFNSFLIHASTIIFTAYSHTTWLQGCLKPQTPCTFINWFFFILSETFPPTHKLEDSPLSLITYVHAPCKIDIIKLCQVSTVRLDTVTRCKYYHEPVTIIYELGFNLIL